MNRRYTTGDMMTLSALFTDPATNRPANPSTVALRLLDPNKVEYRPAVFNPEIGVYTAKHTPQVAGLWHSRWEATGAVQAAIESSFEIGPSAFSTGP